jgi:hypothetical protein
MATAGALAVSPVTAIRDALYAIPEIEQAFVYIDFEQSIAVLTVMADKDYDTQNRIFEAEQEIIEHLPGIKVTFKLVVRCGRPLGELVSPKGNLLFSRVTIANKERAY